MHKGFYFGHQWVPGLSCFLKNRLVKQKLKVAVYDLQWHVISLLGNADVEDKMNSNMFVHWVVTDWHRSFSIQFRMMTVSEQQSTSCNMLLRWALIHYVLPLQVNFIKCIKSGISALKDFLYIFQMWPRSFWQINSRAVECTNEWKKRSERRKHCARAGCSKVRTPPARCHKPTHRQDRLQYTSPQLASVQCN